MAVVLTLVQIKQIRINIRKRNDTKTPYKQYKTQRIQVHILPKHPNIHTPTHYEIDTYTHPHITKQVKTTTVQDTHQMKKSQYNQVPSVNGHPNARYFCPQELHRNFTSLHFKTKSLYISHMRFKIYSFNTSCNYNRRGFIFRVKQSKKRVLLLDPVYEGTKILSKRLELSTQRHGVAFRKAGVSSIVLFHSMKSEKKSYVYWTVHHCDS